jgi:hypothetical protein
VVVAAGPNASVPTMAKLLGDVEAAEGKIEDLTDLAYV